MSHRLKSGLVLIHDAVESEGIGMAKTALDSTQPGQGSREIGRGGVEVEGWGRRRSEGWEVGFDGVKPTTTTPILYQSVVGETHIQVFGCDTQ